jgi:transcription antitermination factor NusG
MDWHIALTEPGSDRIAETALRNRAYLVYRPIEPRRVCGGVRWISMMPGYLFVIDAPADNWQRLRITPGIRTHRCLLPSNGGYAVLSDETIRRIRHVEQDLATVQIDDDPRNGFALGQSVKIGDGLITGIIDGLDDRQKAVVKILLLGRESPVKVPYHELTAVESTV